MSAQNFRIVRLKLDSPQVKEICQMLEEFYDNDYYPYMINDDNKDIDRHSFVALTETKAVAGFILVNIPRRNPNIVQFLVSEASRKQRLGYRLLTKIIQDIERYAHAMDERSKYKIIFLDVPATAQAAIELYERNGFAQTTKASKNIGTTAHRLERKIT